MMKLRLLRVVPLLTLAMIAPAFADDYPDNPHPYGLDPNFPLQVEDASPTPAGKIELQFATIYTRGPAKADSFDFEPQLKFGVVKDVDFHVVVPIVAADGEAGTGGSGQIQVNSQWEFLEEKAGEWWPALAVEGDVNFPTGTGDYGLDLGLEFIATKTVIPGQTQGQVHFNFTENRNAARQADERSYFYNAAIGYSQRLFPKTVIVADLVRSQSNGRNSDENDAEIGFIQSINDKLRVAGGFGLGFGDDSPNFTMTLSFQYEF